MKPLSASLLMLSFVLLNTPNAFGQCEPFFGKLVINEVMAANNNTATDPSGSYEDWVEIHNTTDQSINMEGWFLSDNHGNRTKYVFPNVNIAPNGYLIIWCDDEVDQEGLHAPFRLSAAGEEVGLYNPDSTSVDYVRYGPIQDDITIGRFPNGTGPFKTLIPTFNGPNTNSVDPGLVINEYQAINETTAQDQWGGFEDWVELYNNSSQPIDISGYFLSDKIGEPTQFQFPDTVIPGGEYLIIWCDQGLMEPGLHTFFRLGADGDDLLLSNADTLTVDYVRFEAQIPDDSEGRFGNGTGPMACMIPTFSESNGFPLSAFEVQKETLAIWPNPASDLVWIRNMDTNPIPVRIFDIHGRLVHQTPINPGEQQVDISFLKHGVYIVQVGNSRAKLIRD